MPEIKLEYADNDIYTPISALLAEASRVQALTDLIIKNNHIAHGGGIRQMYGCFGSIFAHAKYIGEMLGGTVPDFDTAFAERVTAVSSSKYPEMVSEIVSTLTKDELFKVFGKYYKKGKWAELGVRGGDGIMKMIQCGAGSIVGVDSWIDDGVIGRNDIETSQDELNSIKRDCFKRFSRNPNVQLIEGYTFEAVKKFDDGYFDVVFIDADHTYEGVMQDINDWWPKVRVGGVLCGHDYLEITINKGVEFGVIKAVNEFRKKNNLTSFHTTAEGSPSWAIVKEPI